MVHEVVSYVMVQEGSANLEYRGLKPSWFLVLRTFTFRFCCSCVWFERQEYCYFLFH